MQGFSLNKVLCYVAAVVRYLNDNARWLDHIIWRARLRGKRMHTWRRKRGEQLLGRLVGEDNDRRP